MADVERRRFLAGTGLAVGLVAGCRSRKDPYASEKPVVPVAPGTRLGAETYVLSTCGGTSSGSDKNYFGGIDNVKTYKA